MQGIFSSSVQSLGEAIYPIAKTCAELEWAISLQSGPFHQHFLVDEDDPRNVLPLFREISENDPHWFRPGLLPKHAEDLVLDEWSYYLGFDGQKISPQSLHESLAGEITPRPRLFDVLQGIPCLYLLFVRDRWWEAYTTKPEIGSLLSVAWQGKTVDSGRWDGRTSGYHPFPEGE